MMFAFLQDQASVDLTRANVPEFSIAELLNTTNTLFSCAQPGAPQEYERVARNMDAIVDAFIAINDASLSVPATADVYRTYLQLRTPYQPPSNMR